MADNNRFDVIIIGAGISGINAAYRLQEGIPDYKYTILEGRHEMGGTWSLFKYPGIRSDSDLHTFGFAWDPWKEDRCIADAPSILRYLKTTAERHGIAQHVQYGHQVENMNWSTEHQHWQLDVFVNGSEKPKQFYARHILLGTGYYDYTTGLETKIPGIQNFKNGPVVHPQFWPEDLDYTDKKVVIIGSGATAVTLLPSMTDKAKSVTMLQRSPSYFLPLPLVIPIDQFIKKVVPERWAYKLIRLRFLLFSFLFVNFCRLFPQRGIKLLRAATEKELPENIPFDPHFVPRYNPWQQRMCITPGGDFFAALRTGKANVVTDTIDTVTETGIKLKSGDRLDADIIITATGLKLRMGGGAKLTVDGEPYPVNQKYVWRGAMLQDLPNLTFVLGYTDASWTLGADATSQLWVRLLKAARAKNMTSIVPRMDEKDKDLVLNKPLLNLNSSYIKAAEQDLPKGGDRGPWIPRSSYWKDIWHAKFGDIQTGLQFYRISS
ncbi:monooxygenase, partial [Aureobasidium melanogenum]